MKIEATPGHFVEIMKKAHSLDTLFLLKLIEEGYSVQTLCTDSAKIKNIYSGIVRKGFVTTEGKITLTGKDLLKFMTTPEGSKLVKRAPDKGDFDTWWKAYPGTDTFIHNGRRFQGSRSLRAGKAKCKQAFHKILEEGEYKAEQLIKALEFDVLQKKEDSLTKSRNGLTFMQNSMTYLNQRSFESYIELMESGVSEGVKSKKAIDTDI